MKFVTSSLEKKAKIIALNAKLASDSTQLREDDLEILPHRRHSVSSTVAYEIAASAACHVQNRAKIKIHTGTYGDTLYLKQYEVCPVARGCNSEVAAQMAATTMTSVVAAKEREKQAAAKELQSLHSSPCEWFICDEPRTSTRFFVIQVKLCLLIGIISYKCTTSVLVTKCYRLIANDFIRDFVGNSCRDQNH